MDNLIGYFETTVVLEPASVWVDPSNMLTGAVTDVVGEPPRSSLVS